MYTVHLYAIIAAHLCIITASSVLYSVFI